MHKNKVVVLLPEDHEDIYEFFPAIFYLSKTLENPELNIVSDHDFSRELLHLPFKTINYFVSKDDLGVMGSLKLHHKLKELFNISHFYNYRSSIGAFNFGRSLKAKNKIGFKDALGKIFYTEERELDISKYPSEQYLDLVLDPSINFSFNKINYNEEIQLPNNFFKSQVHEPFIFLAMGTLEGDENLYLLIKEITEKLTHQRIILWSNQKNGHHQDLLDTFPTLIDATGVEYKNLPQYILTCKGVITDQLNVARLATFIGVDHFFITRKDYKNRKIPHFPFVLGQLYCNEDEIFYTEAEESLKEMKTASEVLDIIHEKFNL